LVSPQEYLDAALSQRGYSIARHRTVETAYHNKPTALQEASYSAHLMDLVRDGKYDALKDLLHSGISPNPCNRHGESLLHAVCRRGSGAAALRIMLGAGCDVQVSDDFGRTPLHDVCWSSRPDFDLVDLLLERDARLVQLVDVRGALPLQYVGKELWREWIDHLESRMDRYWPERAEDAPPQGPPPLALLKPNAPIPDPDNALSLELACMVSAGRIAPEEARLLMNAGDNFGKNDDDGEAVGPTEEEEDEESCGYGHYIDEADSYYDSDGRDADSEVSDLSSDSYCYVNKKEMSEILTMMDQRLAIKHQSTLSTVATTSTTMLVV
jgi:hypothetical protein